MKIALIGATGFVGSHILEELLTREQGYEVIAIARNVEKVDVKTGRTGRYRTGSESPVFKDGVASISVEDFAVAVVKGMEDKTHSRKIYTVGY